MPDDCRSGSRCFTRRIAYGPAALSDLGSAGGSSTRTIAGMAVVDRGYAWVVLASATLLQVFGVGFSIGSIGIMVISFQKAFPASDRSHVAWIGSLRSFQFLFSPIAVLLIKRFGCRIVTIVGALLSAAGIAIASLSTEVWHAYLTFGVIAGVGVAFTFSSSNAVLREYFDKKKNLAFPVASLGNAVGVLVFPYVLQLILDTTSHAIALYIMAALKIVEVACGIVFKPNSPAAADAVQASAAIVSALSASGKPMEANSKGSPFVNGDAVNPRFLMNASLTGGDSPTKLHETSPLTAVATAAVTTAASKDDLISPESVASSPGVVSESFEAALAGTGKPCAAISPPADETIAPATKRERRAAQRSAFLRMAFLLRDWKCWTLLLHSFAWGYTVASTQVLAPVSFKGRGASSRDASLGIAIMGAGMLAGNFVMLGLGSRKYDRFALYLPTCGVLGLCAILLAVSDLVASYFTLCSLFGFAFGILKALFLTVITDFKKPEDYADLFGLYTLFNGIGGLAGPAIMGAMQSFVSDSAGWYLCGSVGICGAAVIVPAYVINRRRRRPPH